MGAGIVLESRVDDALGLGRSGLSMGGVIVGVVMAVGMPSFPCQSNGGALEGGTGCMTVVMTLCIFDG